MVTQPVKSQGIVDKCVHKSKYSQKVFISRIIVGWFYVFMKYQYSNNIIVQMLNENYKFIYYQTMLGSL